jgi:hypothetical protein
MGPDPSPLSATVVKAGSRRLISQGLCTSLRNPPIINREF